MTTTEKIQKIIADKLGTTTDKVTPEIKVGGELQDDSLEQVEIAMAIEDEFGIEISDEDCAEWKTVADAIAYVEKKVGEK